MRASCLKRRVIIAAAVPFIAATAGLGPAGIFLTSVAFQVSGVNDKINQAAANVFGEDLVKVGNLAGLAYGAFSEGGFDLSNFGEAGGETAGALGGAAEAATETAAAATTGGPAEWASNYQSEFGQAMEQGTGALQAPAAPGVQAPALSSTPAPGSNPWDLNQGGPQSWMDKVAKAQATPTPGAAPTWPAMGGDQESGMLAFLKRQLLEKDGRIRNSALAMGGNVISGLGTGYLSYRQRQALEDEARRRETMANSGLVGWRQYN